MKTIWIREEYDDVVYDHFEHDPASHSKQRGKQVEVDEETLARWDAAETFYKAVQEEKEKLYRALD